MVEPFAPATTKNRNLSPLPQFTWLACGATVADSKAVTVLVGVPLAMLQKPVVGTEDVKEALLKRLFDPGFGTAMVGAGVRTMLICAAVPLSARADTENMMPVQTKSNGHRKSRRGVTVFTVKFVTLVLSDVSPIMLNTKHSSCAWSASLTRAPRRVVASWNTSVPVSPFGLASPGKAAIW